MIRLCLALVLAGTCAAANPAATEALNALRSAQGRAAIAYDNKLERAARAHAEDMVRGGFFSHSGSNGSDVGQRLRKAGYRWCTAAENIAKGQRDLADVMQAWAGSPGHRRNMLRREIRAFGIWQGAGNTWVMVLAAPC